LPRTSKAWVKPVADYGPLLAFFIAYSIYDLLTATAALMAATVVALALSLAIERRVPMLPLITAAVVGVFGGLTLYFNDETFIKLKPTIVQALMSAILMGGLAFGKPLLKPLMNATWPMDEAGWRRLTFRFAVFFAAMAVLNEIVWRTQSTDLWVTFKVFGLMGLTFLFGMCQMPLLNRHSTAEAASRKDSGS
jgi:intracellular septation protein